MGSHLPFTHQAVSLVKPGWTKTLDALLSIVRRDLFLASPFIKLPVANEILSRLEKRGLQARLHLSVLTDLRPESSLSGSTDLDAFLELGRRVANFELTHLPSLHAKVYVADTKMAVVTSANLTGRGVNGNVEYGVAFTDETTVKEIRSDFEVYTALGAKISLGDLQPLMFEIAELRALYVKAQNSIRRKAARAFKRKLESTQLELLRRRARGKTTHSILSETVRYLLAKGPLRTSELHPLIQMLHPDLCDDSVDRVIDGVHFGKRWKHYVRNAQQHLRRLGAITYDGERWHLVRSSHDYIGVNC